MALKKPYGSLGDWIELLLSQGKNAFSQPQ
jgi:hypothetical protein